MLAFEVEYLLWRVFAGDFGDRSSSEWPPHTGRLFSALAASFFDNGGAKRERAALEWLENQSPPCLHAGEAGHSCVTQVFVPTTILVMGRQSCGVSSPATFQLRVRPRLWFISSGRKRSRR